SIYTLSLHDALPIYSPRTGQSVYLELSGAGASGDIFRWLGGSRSVLCHFGLCHRQDTAAPTAGPHSRPERYPYRAGVLASASLAPAPLGLAMAAAEAAGSGGFPRQRHLRQYPRHPRSHCRRGAEYCHPALSRHLHAYRIWRKLRVLESVAGGAVLSAAAAHRAAHTPLAGTGVAADRALSTIAGTHPGDDGIAL